MIKTVAEAILGQHLWAIKTLDRESVASVLLQKEAFLQSWDQGSDDPNTLPVSYIGNTAMVRVSGTILYGVGYYRWASITDVALLENTIKQLGENQSTDKIIIHFESPGGTVSGVDQCAETIFETARIKPIYAYSSDVMCSAAYWLASACSKIVVQKTAEVGSIGVRMRHVEYSKMDQAMGITVTDFGSGEFKTLGSDATPLTDKEKEKFQSMVDKTASIFFDAVSKYRGLDAKDIKALEADVFLGIDAVSVGLADKMGVLDDLINEQTGTGSKTTRKKKGSNSMDRLIEGLQSQYPEAKDAMSSIVSQVKGHLSASHDQAAKANEDTITKLNTALADALAKNDELIVVVGDLTKTVVENIWDAKLAGKSIPDDILPDIKKMVDASAFCKDGIIDTGEFASAVQTKVDVWASKFVPHEPDDPGEDKQVQGGTAQVSPNTGKQKSGYNADYIKNLKSNRKKKP